MAVNKNREHLVTATYGVRWQSGAATALWFTTAPADYKSGVALRLPPHSIVSVRMSLGGSGKMLPKNLNPAAGLAETQAVEQGLGKAIHAGGNGLAF